MSFRTGFGFDVHPFSDDSTRRLILGGVVFENCNGLVGHSDADVVCHAVSDALLGAAGLGDMGAHFPDTDPRFEGANSLELLAEVKTLIGNAGWKCSNVDLTVVTESPKLAAARSEMEKNLSAAIGAPVNVKATRAEGLGAIGRGEGIMCWASALVEPIGN